jgi:hypothetical protein
MSRSAQQQKSGLRRLQIRQYRAHALLPLAAQSAVEAIFCGLGLARFVARRISLKSISARRRP